MKRLIRQAILLLIIFISMGIFVPRHTKAAILSEENRKEFKNYLKKGTEKSSAINGEIWFDSFMLHDINLDGQKDLVIQGHVGKTTDAQPIILINVSAKGKNKINLLLNEHLETVSSKGILTVNKDLIPEKEDQFTIHQEIWAWSMGNMMQPIVQKCDYLMYSEDDYKDKLTGVIWKNAKQFQESEYSYLDRGISGFISRYEFKKVYKSYEFTKKAMLYKVTLENIRKVIG